MTEFALQTDDELRGFVAPRRLEVKPDGGTPFVIRAYEPGDGELKRQSCNSYDHLKRWMSWAEQEESSTSSEQRVLFFHEQYERCTDFPLLITTVDGSQLLGGTGFHLREGELSSRCAEIGLWIAGDFAGRGLGTRVVTQMIKWGFSEWPFLRLSYKTDSRNLASKRVAEKSGMLHEGTLRGQKAEVGPGRRDTLCYAALKDEWSDPAPRSYG